MLKNFASISVLSYSMEELRGVLVVDWSVVLSQIVVAVAVALR